LNWKQTRFDQLKKILARSIPFTLVFMVLLSAIYLSEFHLGSAVGILFASWVFSSIATDLSIKIQQAPSVSVAFKRLRLSYYGMQLGHIGFAVTIVGVALVSSDGIERDVKMSPGDSVEINEYRFEFMGTQEITRANFKADQGIVNVYEDGKFITVLKPEKRYYFSQMSNVMTDAAIHATLARDLFVALGEPLDNGAWAVRLQLKPLIRWIWLGAVFMMLGSFLAIADKRYRS
jgi:cytochrome c-type biogenesis protein CcmF